MSLLQPLLIDKPLGATPLQALGLLRAQKPEFQNTKLAYAGRLDPMASGILPVLHGEMLQHQEDYWYLSKRYETTILIGIGTDSHDLLGMPKRFDIPAPDPAHLTAAVSGLVGKMYLSVPVLSSYQFRNNLSTIPVRCMAVNQIDVLAMDSMDARTLNIVAHERIPRVQGDFRQQKILNAWQTILAHNGRWTIVLLDIRCASGTYVRSLAHELGRRLGTDATLLNLRRTQIGPWKLSDADVVHVMW